jgi:hypothetical protein
MPSGPVFFQTQQRDIMTKTLHGRIRGRTIELDEDPEIADGQEVIVQVKIVPVPSRKTGDGILRTAGALADDTEWDAIMEEIYRARKLERRPQVPDLGEP